MSQFSCKNTQDFFSRNLLFECTYWDAALLLLGVDKIRPPLIIFHFSGTRPNSGNDTSPVPSVCLNLQLFQGGHLDEDVFIEGGNLVVSKPPSQSRYCKGSRDEKKVLSSPYISFPDRLLIPFSTRRYHRSPTVFAWHPNPTPVKFRVVVLTVASG